MVDQSASASQPRASTMQPFAPLQAQPLRAVSTMQRELVLKRSQAHVTAAAGLFLTFGFILIVTCYGTFHSGRWWHHADAWMGVLYLLPFALGCFYLGLGLFFLRERAAIPPSQFESELRFSGNIRSNMLKARVRRNCFRLIFAVALVLHAAVAWVYLSHRQHLQVDRMGVALYRANVNARERSLALYMQRRNWVHLWEGSNEVRKASKGSSSKVLPHGVTRKWSKGSSSWSLMSEADGTAESRKTTKESSSAPAPPSVAGPQQQQAAQGSRDQKSPPWNAARVVGLQDRGPWSGQYGVYDQSQKDYIRRRMGLRLDGEDGEEAGSEQEHAPESAEAHGARCRFFEELAESFTNRWLDFACENVDRSHMMRALKNPSNRADGPGSGGTNGASRILYEKINAGAATSLYGGLYSLSDENYFERVNIVDHSKTQCAESNHVLTRTAAGSWTAPWYIRAAKADHFEFDILKQQKYAPSTDYVRQCIDFVRFHQLLSLDRPIATRVPTDYQEDGRPLRGVGTGGGGGSAANSFSGENFILRRFPEHYIGKALLQRQQNDYDRYYRTHGARGRGAGGGQHPPGGIPNPPPRPRGLGSSSGWLSESELQTPNANLQMRDRVSKDLLLVNQTGLAHADGLGTLISYPTIRVDADRFPEMRVCNCKHNIFKPLLLGSGTVFYACAENDQILHKFQENVQLLLETFLAASAGDGVDPYVPEDGSASAGRKALQQPRQIENFSFGEEIERTSFGGSDDVSWPNDEFQRSGTPSQFGVGAPSSQPGASVVSGRPGAHWNANAAFGGGGTDRRGGQLAPGAGGVLQHPRVGGGGVGKAGPRGSVQNAAYPEEPDSPMMGYPSFLNKNAKGVVDAFLPQRPGDEPKSLSDPKVAKEMENHLKLKYALNPERFSCCCLFISPRDLIPTVVSKDLCLKKLREMNFVNPTAEDYTLVFTQGYVRHVQVERVYPNLIQWPGGSKFAKHPGTVKAIDRNMVKVLWNMASGYEAERILRVGKKLKTMELEKNAQYYVDQQKFQLLHHRADGYYLDFRKCARPAIAAVVAVAADGGAEIAGGGAGAGGEPAAAKGAGAAEGGMGNEQKAGARQQEPQQQAQEQPPEAANAAAPKAAGGAASGQQGEGIGRKKVYFADSEAEFLRVMEEVGMGPKDSFLPQLLLQSDSVRDCYKNSAASQQRFLSDFKISVQICRLYDDYTKRKHQQGRPQQLPKEGEILANRFFDEGASGEFDDDFFTSWEDDLAKQKKVRFNDQADADAQQEDDEGAARGDVEGGGGEARGAAFRGRSWRTRKPHDYTWDRDYFDDEDEDSAAEDAALLSLPLSEDDDPWHDDPVAQVEMGEDLFRYALHLKQKASVRSRARAQVDGEGKVIQHFGDERDDDVDADQVSGNEFGRFREEVAKDFLREEDEEQIMLPVADYGRKKWICDRMTKMGQDADPLICHEVFQCFIPHSFLLYCPHDVSNEGGRPSWRHYVRQEAAPRSEFTLPVQTVARTLQHNIQLKKLDFSHCAVSTATSDTSGYISTKDRALWLRNRVWSWGLVYRGTRNDLDGVDAFNEAGGAGVAAAAGNFRDGALSSDAEGRGGGLNAAGITQESLSTQLLSMLEFGGGSRNPESRAGSKGRSGRLSGRPLGANLRPGHELRAARGQMRAMGWSSEQSQGQNELGPGAKLRSFIGETDFEPHVMAWRVAQAWTYPSPGTVGLYLDRFEARDDLVLFCQGWETYLGAMEWNYTNVGLIGLLFILAEMVLTLGAILALRCWLRAKAPKKAKRRASAIKGAYVYSGGRFSSLAMGRGTNDNDVSAAEYASGMTEALQRTSEMRERQSQMQQRQSQKMDACTNNYVGQRTSQVRSDQTLRRRRTGGGANRASGARDADPRPRNFVQEEEEESVTGSSDRDERDENDSDYSEGYGEPHRLRRSGHRAAGSGSGRGGRGRRVRGSKVPASPMSSSSSSEHEADPQRFLLSTRQRFLLQKDSQPSSASTSPHKRQGKPLEPKQEQQHPRGTRGSSSSSSSSTSSSSKRAENENLCADAILGRESTCARASIGTMRSSLLARISAGVPADRDENAPASQHEAGVELASIMKKPPPPPPPPEENG